MDHPAPAAFLLTPTGKIPMRRSLLSPASLLLAASLGACGFMTPPQQYPGLKRPGAEIAVIQAYQGSLMGDEYHATIAGYAQPAGSAGPAVKRFGLPGFTDYPHEIHLDPGPYTLEMYCFKSLALPTYRPTFDIAVKAGHVYTVKCDAAQGHATVSVSQDTRAL
jgi:hypothetical protein